MVMAIGAFYLWRPGRGGTLHHQNTIKRSTITAPENSEIDLMVLFEVCFDRGFHAAAGVSE
jgi:hypothetical protein